MGVSGLKNERKEVKMRDDYQLKADRDKAAEAIRVVVIDDDPAIVSKISALISEMEGVTLSATADSCAKGATAIRDHDPQILFLDVQLPDGTAFDMLSTLGAVSCQLIFITAYEEYALEAIKNAASDFLLKPFGRTDVAEAMEKAVRRENERAAIAQAAPQTLGRLSVVTPRIGLHDQTGIHFFDLNQIVRCRAEGNYTEFYLTCGRRLVVTALIGQYEDLLQEHGFHRVSRSHIVNISHVSRYISAGNGTVVTSDGAEIDLSRRRKAEFVQALSSFGITTLSQHGAS